MTKVLSEFLNCFLEQPWDDYSCPIRVGRNITSLKWSQSGEKLLIGDSLGRLILFTMHEYSSSEWDQEILYEGVDQNKDIISIFYFAETLWSLERIILIHWKVKEMELFLVAGFIMV